MSEQRFIELLQNLITMANPKSETSMRCCISILENLFAVAKDSGKCDSIVLRMINESIHDFRSLVNHKKDYAGTPGDFEANHHKRRRLHMAVRPGC